MSESQYTINLNEIEDVSKPVFAGVQFDSRPAAMRHLKVAKEVVDRFGGTGAVGLDIGSKYGLFRRVVKEYGISAIRLDVVVRDDKDGLIVGNGKKLPFNDGVLDFVVVSHVLAHIDDLPPFMSEIRRALKPTGKLFILQNNRYGWWKYWGYYIKRNDRALHYRTFSKWDIRELLRKNGFAINSMKSPYYFYLHSKFSDLCYRFDRKYGGIIPLWLATQWLVVAEASAASDDGGRKIKLSLAAKPLIEVAAFTHSVAMKALELFIRATHK